VNEVYGETSIMLVHLIYLGLTPWQKELKCVTKINVKGSNIPKINYGTKLIPNKQLRDQLIPNKQLRDQKNSLALLYIHYKH